MTTKTRKTRSASRPKPRATRKKPARKDKPELPVIDTEPYTPGRLVPLGVYGFKKQELAILTALVTGDPMLLIGRSGTGKTYLLNSLSEALGLEHRHYNASLISFDDLVGFPYPDEEKSGIRFLETPATVWGAESVLVDEISRCKPEHQNRLFSLVHERRVQGIALERLRYRWAAMNPCSADQGNFTEDYMGSQALDPALADRFAVIIEVGDWESLSAIDRKRIADPTGEGAVSDDGGALAGDLELWRQRFDDNAGRLTPFIVDYVCDTVTALGDGGIRVSPRRARLVTRTLLAAWCITGLLDREEALELLICSLPHKAWGETLDTAQVAAAHRVGWEALTLDGDGRWVHDFHIEKDLAKKAEKLLKDCPGEDAGTLAVEQLLSNESPERAAAFALAAFPAAVAGKLRVGAEGVNDLGRIAQHLLTVEGMMSWAERLSEKGTKHPEFERIAPVLARLKGGRKERATQYFYWCLVNDVVLDDPVAAEDQLHRCTLAFGKGRVS
jgi:MoxR-like ATPase